MINNNPEQKSVKYKCRVSGEYNSPTGDEVRRGGEDIGEDFGGGG